MKRIFSMFLAALLIFGTLVVTVHADDFAATVTVTPDTVQANEDVVVTVTMPTGLPKLVSTAFSVTFDPANLTYVGVQNVGSDVFLVNNGVLKGNSNANDIFEGDDYSGKTWIINFKSTETAVAGDYTISVAFSAEDTLTADYDEISIEGASATVTIEAAPCTHNMTAHDAVAATCIASGNVAYYSCSVCGKNFKDEAGTEEIEDVTTPVNEDNHVNTAPVAAVDATCTETGLTEGIECLDCEKIVKEQEVIDALGHDYTEKIEDEEHLVSKAANCQEHDTYWYDCSRCDANAKDDSEATDKWYETETVGEHQWSDKWDFITAEGHAHKCTIEGCTETSEIAKHIPDKEAATEDEGVKCTECEYVIETALGHLCSLHLTPVVANDPDCEKDGNIAYYVCECGKYYEDNTAEKEITDKTSVIIAALGHDYSEESEEQRSAAANCQEHDTYWYGCSRCDANAKDDEKATDKWYETETVGEHSWSEVWDYSDENGHAHKCLIERCEEHTEIEKHIPNMDAPTETEPVKCTVCEYILKNELGHLCSLHLTFVEAKEANCGTEGNLAYYVCECGKYYEDKMAEKEITDKTSVIIKNGHLWGEWEVTTPATCTEAGEETRTCQRENCDAPETATETREVAALGHDFGEWIQTKAPTEDEEGEERRDCSRCDAYETRTLEALGTPFMDEWYWTMVMLHNQSYEIEADAEDGDISPNGVTKVKFAQSITYTITPDEGYEIEAVYVDGKNVGAVSEYTFKRVTKDHTIYAVCAEIEEEPAIGDEIVSTYVDVDVDDWFYDAVETVTAHGLMNGTGDGKFSPEVSTNRAMLVTILWRIEGEADAEPSAFTDVADDMWYTAAIDWAAANGIVNGYEDGTFGPEKAVTREQVMAILHRYAAYRGVTDDVAVSMIPQYDCSVWAENDVNWADMHGLLDNLGVDVTDMTAEASRAEIAAYLADFCVNVIQ